METNVPKPPDGLIAKNKTGATDDVTLAGKSENRMEVDGSTATRTDDITDRRNQ